ncbi:unnamed protein product [Heligmosomoides polygyrus]|uniref:Pinin_SDK_memA domain-containing protein n=1 Tax=Heligmosomoides polygyrus TaxID=6339 RepID=A0A183GU82_HELPZ|nr:unnamed protein product [Heligmosomoides polygyrus]
MALQALFHNRRQEELRDFKLKDVLNKLNMEAADFQEWLRRMGLLAIVSVNRAEIQKKQREAEELRKAALKAGIQVGAEEERHNEEITAALAAVVTEADRIPPIPVIEEPTAVVGDAEDPLEVRRKQIRENIRKEKERREQVNQRIREKLAAMEARKQRMQEIRRLLTETQGWPLPLCAVECP